MFRKNAMLKSPKTYKYSIVPFTRGPARLRNESFSCVACSHPRKGLGLLAAPGAGLLPVMGLC